MGTKIKNLLKLKSNEFLVPDFVIADIRFSTAQRAALDKILKKAQTGDFENTQIEAEEILEDVKVVLPDSLDTKKLYAVRSSAESEDLPSFSFAGQYESFLNVKYDGLKAAVIDCYKSFFSLKNLSYCIKSGVGVLKNDMSVIVQEMVDADFSGVALGVNYLTGSDIEFLVEVCVGAGGVVAGLDNPSSYVYDWYNDKEVSSYEKDAVLSQGQKRALYRNLLDIQCLYGYPVDIEFAFCGENLFILQARPITKIFYNDIVDEYTTANFKDGGVSAGACNMLLFSLYEKTFEDSMRHFYLKTKAFKDEEMNKLIIMRFARPYWNCSVTKGSLLKIPGFTERKYDEELGLKIVYEGDGRKSNIKLKNLPEVLKIMLACLKILKNNKKTALDEIENHADTAKKYFDINEKSLTLEETEKLFCKLIEKDYYAAEHDYFTQVFINILKIKMVKNKFKRLCESEFLLLVSGINSVSHIRMHKAVLDAAGKIKADGKLLSYWQKTAQEIKTDYENGIRINGLKMIEEFISAYGYHSERELDITYPNFDEDCIYAIKIFKKAILSQEYGLNENANQKHKKEKRAVKQIKKYLWIREELKDVSTRFYYLIRKFTLRIAELYRDRGFIKNAEDIFHLRFEDIFDFMQNKDTTALKEKIQKNKSYYNSFINFDADTEIGRGRVAARPAVCGKTIKGIACSPVSYKGIARVILSNTDLDKLESGEIIVSKFADAACMIKFCVAGGVVTETGGSMCHSSIVAREYGIAAVAGASGILKAVKTGDILYINGERGEVVLSER